MKYVRRKWFQLIRDQKHTELPTFLLDLKVINANQFREFLDITHETFRNYQLDKQRRKSHTESRNSNVTLRPPRSIKPTKARF